MMGSNFERMIEKLADCLQNSDVMAAEQQAKIAAMIMRSRLDRQMSQKEFAEFMGVSQSMVSKWESEDYNFTIESLAKICDKLNLELDIEMRPYSEAKSQYNQVSTWNVAPYINRLAGGVA